MNKLESIIGASIRKPSVTITDEDVSEVLLTLRKQRMQWKPVRRPARFGDRVALTYTASCRGQVIESHETTPRLVVLGSEGFYKNLERRSLLEAKKGENIIAKTLLPHDYPDSNLARKCAVFNIFVTEVCKPVLPAMNRQFALDLGLSSGGAKTMHKEIRSVMQRKVDSIAKQYIRKQVIDLLLSEYPLTIDEEEIQQEMNRRQETQTIVDQTDHTVGESSQLTIEHLRVFAKLNVILRDIIRTENIVVDTKRLKTTITALALRTDNPEKTIKSHYNNFEELSRIESEILEDQVVEHVLSYLPVKPVPSTYKEFTSAQNTSLPSDDWLMQPIIQLRAENKCSFCGPSKCCQYATQKIPAPRSKHDFDHLLWKVSHENIEVFKDNSGWHLLFNTTCAHLQLDGRCGIYENRPSVCRNYSVKNCEFDGEASEGWNLYFSDYKSLLGYCEKRFKRWGDD